MITLADCLEALTGRTCQTSSVTFGEAVIDSRAVTPGALFVALPGEHTDGHDFVADALAGGVAGALVHRDLNLNPQPAVIDTRRELDTALLGQVVPPLLIRVEDTLHALQTIAAHRRAQHPVKVVGVTGSVGKTTTKEMVAAVLSQRYETLKNEGNLNNEIGLPLTLLRLEPHHQRAVLEMGMYARGEIAALAAIARPHIGVVTNVGPSHLSRLGSLEAIAEAKAELVEALPADGVAVLNADDAQVRAMAARTAATVFTYGLDPGADLWADQVDSLGLDGISFWLHYAGEQLFVKVPLLGRHSVHTALAAAAVGLVDSLTWQEILDGLQDPKGQLRLVVVPGINDCTLLDDTYNASPASMLAALNLLADLNGRKIAALGGMLELGHLEPEGHEKVGVRAATVVDELVAVGDLGRRIGQAALRAGLSGEQVHFAADNAAAAQVLKRVIEPGDIVLVKGSRALQMEEIVAALALPENG